MSLCIRVQGTPQCKCDLNMVRRFVPRANCDAVICHCRRRTFELAKRLVGCRHRRATKLDSLIRRQNSNTISCLESKQVPQCFSRGGSARSQVSKCTSGGLTDLCTRGDFFHALKSRIFFVQIQHNLQVGMRIKRYEEDRLRKLSFSLQPHQRPFVPVFLRHPHSESALLASCFQSYPNRNQRRRARQPVGNRAQIPRLPQRGVNRRAKRQRHDGDCNPKLGPFNSHCRAPGLRRTLQHASSTPGSKDSHQ